MITVERVITAVAEIKFLAERGDDDRAHNDEDSLYVDVLEAIASGRLSGPEAALLAGEAYKTGAIEFSRYTA